MLPLVLGFGASVTSCLWRLELQHHLRVPPAGSSQQDALLVGAIPRDRHPSSIHPSMRCRKRQPSVRSSSEPSAHPRC